MLFIHFALPPHPFIPFLALNVGRFRISSLASSTLSIACRTKPFVISFLSGHRRLYGKAMAEPDADLSDSSSSDALIHVLAVDDCLVDRKVVEKLLKTAKFKVSIVESGKKAMEFLQLNEEKIESPTADDQKIDIILTDYCMPEMNGYDLLKAVKDDNCLKSMPVVIMSSEHVPERISSCLAAGAEDFIQKPLKLRDLQRLRSFVRPVTPIPVIGMKRKVPLDLLPDSNPSERRPHLAGVAVA